MDWVQTGLEAEFALEANEFDLLILTGLDGVSDRVKGLDAVADDYLAKPFDLAELEARVRALVRRGMSGGPTLIKHGALAYDQVGRVTWLNRGAVDLSERELSLPEVFLQRVGRLVSKDQLVNHLCEWGEEVSANAIEVYVHRLRRKLEPGGVKIVTGRGPGYSLEKPEARRGGCSGGFAIILPLQTAPGSWGASLKAK